MNGRTMVMSSSLESRSKKVAETEDYSRSLFPAITFSWYLEGIQFVDDEKKKGSITYLCNVYRCPTPKMDTRTSALTFAELLWSCS